MDSFKEFQGKSLDEAISEACAYFDTPREKLEIEIVQDSKSGIFGLVGARKAKVRARRVQLRTAVEDILGRKSGLTLNTGDDAEAGQGKKPGDDKPESSDTSDKHDQRAKHEARDRHDKSERQQDKSQDKACTRPDKGQDKGQDRHGDKSDRGERGDRGEARGRKERERAEDLSPANTDAVSAASAEVSSAPRAEKPERQERQERQERGGEGRRGKPGQKNADRRQERGAERQGEGRARGKAPRPRQEEPTFHGDAFGDEVLHEDGDDLQRIPFEDLDQDRLRTLSLEVVGKLVTPIVGELPLTVELQDGRVNVRMDCGDDSGLLIGREGQTLASLQYLASRMVSRGMNAAVRVQLDAGEYRLRQDEKLREMALSLAEKVRATGKSHSTRPLSSYHRRIVHLVLQDSADVQTRSSGDGPLKRVVIQRKR